jgi:hypothetical protein
LWNWRPINKPLKLKPIKYVCLFYKVNFRSLSNIDLKKFLLKQNLHTDLIVSIQNFSTATTRQSMGYRFQIRILPRQHHVAIPTASKEFVNDCSVEKLRIYPRRGEELVVTAFHWFEVLTNGRIELTLPLM